VGKQVVVNFIRQGVAHTTTVKIAESPKNPEPDAMSEEAMPDLGTDPVPAAPDQSFAKGDSALSGLTVTDLNDKTRQKYGIDDMITSGVVITSVQEGSPADLRGILAGDVIEIASAQHASIEALVNPGDFTGLTKKLKPDQGVVLLVHHGKTSGQEDRSSMFVYLGPQPK
jgi:S1-C subfamily serine protease